MKKLHVLIMLALFLLSSCEKGSLPEVETLPLSIADATHITLNGNVINEGRTAVTDRGFCWGLVTNPTVNDNLSNNGFGTGQFTENIIIIPDTTYYIRAYALNSKGAAYGSQISFSTNDPFPGSFTDSRDGTRYRWIKIGDQKWMAENLSYLPSVSPSSAGSATSPYYYVYNYQDSSISDAKAIENYSTYGVLYNWVAAKTACPSDWHLPSDAEWTTLIDYLGTSAGGKMKETGTTHWLSPNTGATNESGFTASPGGYRTDGGGFSTLGGIALFWSSSEAGTTTAWYRRLRYYVGGVHRYSGYKMRGFSVRCLQN